MDRDAFKESKSIGVCTEPHYEHSLDDYSKVYRALSDEQKEIICTHIAEGGSVKKLIQKKIIPGLSWSLLHKELDRDKIFLDAYKKARRLQAEWYADEIMDIADDSCRDKDKRLDKSGQEYDHIDFEVVMRSKLRVDVRKWILERLLSKSYGNSANLNIGGQEGNPIQVVDFSALKQEEKTGEQIEK